eukprot:gene13141-8875_t
MSNQGTPRNNENFQTPESTPKKSEDEQKVKIPPFPFNTVTTQQLVPNTGLNLDFKKKMENSKKRSKSLKPKKEESESDSESELEYFGNISQTPEEYDEQQSKKELKEIMKKSGLLDTPANMLEIGIAHYRNQKKIDNLTDLVGQQKLKKIKIDSIKEEVEEAWKDAYDRFKQH